MRGRAAVCRVADYSPAPSGLGREPGRPGPGEGPRLCRLCLRGGAMGRRAACCSKTSGRDSLPAAHPRALQGSTGRVDAGSAPQPGCEQGWRVVFPSGGAGGRLGWGSPPVWGGVGGCRGGGWVAGGSSPVGWLGGVSGLEVCQLRSLWRPWRRPVQPFLSGVSARTSRVTQQGAGARTLAQDQPPASSSLPALPCSLADPNHAHRLESSCSHTHSHSQKPDAQCPEGKQATQARGHTGLESRPHSRFQVFERQGKSQPCR